MMIDCPCGCGAAPLVGIELEPGLIVGAPAEAWADASNVMLEEIPADVRRWMGDNGHLLPPVPGYRYTEEYLLEPEPTTVEDPDPWAVGPDGAIERRSRG